MRLDIITIFPQAVEEFLQTSITGRAQKQRLVKIEVHDLRQWSVGKNKSVDDRPYGGGPGMLIRVDVLHSAIEAVKQFNSGAPVVLLTPQGKTYQQKIAAKWAKLPGLILVAGHYEGFDDRIRKYVDIELSIGDFVLTGGELPAMMVIDSLVRLIPGVLGDETSAVRDSFSTGQLDFPQFTRPENFLGDKVPTVLLSGHHQQIENWRQDQAKKRTLKRRPDLL